MIRRPPRSTRTDTLCPYTTLFRSYLEAEVGGLTVASIYLPNGNPVPGPKFDYKLQWFERLIAHAGELLAQEVPLVLAGDYNVCPEDRDAFSMKAMATDALVQPESRSAWRRLVFQGWTDALRSEEHTSELQYLMSTSDAAFCL